MKLPDSVISEGVLRLDWTAYSHILKCFRDAWHLIAWRRELDADHSALRFGQAIHAALQERQRHGAGPYGPKVAALVEAAALKSLEGYSCPEDDHRTPGRAVEVAGLYQQAWPEEQCEILGNEQARERELGTTEFQRFDRLGRHVETHSVKIIWQGRADGIWRKNGTVAIKDTKTTSYLSVVDAHAEFKMSPQFKLYCWLFSGGDWGVVRDAIVDLIIIRKPVLKATAKTLPRTEFHRLPLTFTDGQIAECQRDVMRTVGLWLTACATEGMAPPMTGAPLNCKRFNRPCPYLPVCENPDEPSRIRWLLGAQYREWTWNPMEVRDV